jgi:hypothetical protein
LENARKLGNPRLVVLWYFEKGIRREREETAPASSRRARGRTFRRARFIALPEIRAQRTLMTT